MTRDRKTWVAFTFRMLTGAVALSVATSAAGAFWRELASADLVAVAERLISAEPLSEARAGRLEAALMGRDGPSGCSAEARARAVINYHIVGATRLDADVARLDARFDRAEEALQAALRCAPLDGYLWLIRTRLEVSRSGPTEAALRYLRLSYANAPAEGWIVARRVGLVRELYDVGVDGVESELRHDIRLISRFAHPKRVAQEFERASPRVRALLIEAIGPLEKPRKDHLEWLIPALRQHRIKSAQARIAPDSNERVTDDPGGATAVGIPATIIEVQQNLPHVAIVGGGFLQREPV